MQLSAAEHQLYIMPLDFGQLYAFRGLVTSEDGQSLLQDAVFHENGVLNGCGLFKSIDGVFIVY